MKALVTGASGFAGSWLCRTLTSRGTDTVGWSRHAPDLKIQGVHYKQVDVRNRSDVLKMMPHDVDVVFHLAAMANVAACERDPILAQATNVQGTINVFHAMPEHARGLLTSTCHVYGKPANLPLHETAACTPIGVYANTKLEAEKAAKALDRDIVIVRAFHHTGPGQSTEYALADWAQQVRLAAQQIVVGNLEIRRDYSDVRDVVDGYTVAAESGLRGDTYNLCTGKSHSLERLLQILTKGAVKIAPQSDRFRATDVPDLYGDPSKLRALGWRQQYSIEETLESML